jgi:CrcB protein
MGYAAFIWVFAGGTAGSLAREMLAPLLPGFQVWLPILIINVIASFLIGWLYVARDSLHPRMMHLGAVGFCGGFSTFSHFTQDTSDLILAGRALETLAMVVAAVGLGLAAAVAGEAAGRRAMR